MAACAAPLPEKGKLQSTRATLNGDCLRCTQGTTKSSATLKSLSEVCSFFPWHAVSHFNQALLQQQQCLLQGTPAAFNCHVEHFFQLCLRHTTPPRPGRGATLGRIA